MTQNKNDHSVLIIDDEIDNTDLFKQILKDDYDVCVANSGQKALEILEKKIFDLILLDIRMPGMDGYTTCKKIKADTKNIDVDIVFVSGLDSTEEIVACYEAGGSDYLLKPVRASELLHKVRLAIENRSKRIAAEKHEKDAVATAMTAISSAGEQGVVLEFLQHSFTVKNHDELAKLICKATKQYDLDSTVLIRSKDKLIYAGSSESISPLAKELLIRLKDSGRIREKDNYFLANFGNITQLIKKMPDDPDKRGRLRDHLALLLEGAAAKADALDTQQNAENLLIDMSYTVSKVNQLQSDYKEQAVHIMDDVLQKLEKSFLTYGLTEEQEKILMNIVQDGINQSLENMDKSVLIDNLLNDVLRKLSEHVEK